MAVGSIAKFLKAINNIPYDSKKNCMRFYRGHHTKGWKLVPSLLRKNYKHLKEKESEIFKELHIHYPDFFIGCENIFEEMVLAQHYGIPTRLLDITSNPLVALYFAIYNKPPKSGDAEVFIIDVPKNAIVYYDDYNMLEALKASLEGNHSKSQHSIICVKARLNNPRIIRQNGAFLFFSNKNENCHSIIKNIINIDINKSSILRIKTELKTLGISSTTLFPELIHYAECLKKDEIII